MRVLRFIFLLATAVSFLLLSGCQSQAKENLHIVDASHCGNVNVHDPFLLVLKRGDELISSLQMCAKSAHLSSAVVSGGVGALENPTIAYYSRKDHGYHKRSLDGGDYELLSASGNVTWLDNKPFAHIHVTLGDTNYQVYGGHLMKGTVAVVGELMVTPLQAKGVRQWNSAIQLNTITPNS